MSQLINVKAAREEISSLSRNAKLYLQDRLGNGLHGIRMVNHTRVHDDNIEKNIVKLVDEMRKMGLFD